MSRINYKVPRWVKKKMENELYQYWDNKKELEESNRIYALNGSNIKLELHIKENYIPVQKVKVKIEELDIAILECEYDDDDVEEYKNDVEKEKRILLIKKSALEELLEEK